MRRVLIAATAFVLFATNANAQVMQAEKPYIQVNASAEREVVPDEIYVNITLAEKLDGRGKMSLEDQERKLRERLKASNIPAADLTVSDMDAAFTRVRWFEKDVVAEKTYTLKVTGAEKLSAAFDALKDLNVKDAGLSRVDYSKKEELKKQLRTEAIQKAKEQAKSMLAAIDETMGKPLYIFEHSNNIYPVAMYAKRGVMSMEAADQAGAEEPLEFRKIKFTANVDAKFEIK